MATRPWVIPQEVKDYTEIPSVANREDHRLVIDISRAETFIINYTNRTFEEFEVIPDSVRTATILLAEAYAFNAANTANSAKGGVKTETFDDYSYTLFDPQNIDLDLLGIGPLLDEWVIAKGTVTMKMRKL